MQLKCLILLLVESRVWFISCIELPSAFNCLHCLSNKFWHVVHFPWSVMEAKPAYRAADWSHWSAHIAWLIGKIETPISLHVVFGIWCVPPVFRISKSLGYLQLMMVFLTFGAQVRRYGFLCRIWRGSWLQMFCGRKHSQPRAYFRVNRYHATHLIVGFCLQKNWFEAMSPKHFIFNVATTRLAGHSRRFHHS